MTPSVRHRGDREPRLWEERRGDRTVRWTRTPGRLPAVYGERWIERGGVLWRQWEPTRSKLAAAIEVGWAGDLPAPGDRWLYLGAASGTTASHVADLVGPAGRVYAVERSPRPFRRLLGWAERWPNVLPILADAREPSRFAMQVPMVDGLYVDIAQPDQVRLALENARARLRPGGALLLALKTASMGREAGPADHLAQASEYLARWIDLEESVRLSPFHRGHYFLGGRAREELGRLPDEALTWVPASLAPRPPSRRPRPAGRGPDRRSDRGTGRWRPRPGRPGTTGEDRPGAGREDRPRSTRRAG